MPNKRNKNLTNAFKFPKFKVKQSRKKVKQRRLYTQFNQCMTYLLKITLVKLDLYFIDNFPMVNVTCFNLFLFGIDGTIKYSLSPNIIN